MRTSFNLLPQLAGIASLASLPVMCLWCDPAGAFGYRVGCRRVGAQTYTVHWFPTQPQRKICLFKLDPIEAPVDIPCPAEYAVAYFDAMGNLVDVPRFKLALRVRVIGILWSEGDRRLLLNLMPR